MKSCASADMDKVLYCCYVNSGAPTALLAACVDVLEFGGEVWKLLGC